MDAEKKLRVCVPICEATISAARVTIARAEKVADIIELRLDCLSPLELNKAGELKSLLGGLSVPVIVTLRPREQGGTREFDLALRKRDWFSGTDSAQILRDVELDLALEDPGAFRSARMDRLICSHHDFSGLLLNAEQIYEQLAGTPAGILKLAVQAHDVTDCIPIFQLLDRARREQRELIGIAMGDAGLATRILGPSRGAFMTYAALDAQSAIAPGQPTVDDLRNQYRIQKINLETQVMGLVGMPVRHSVSPKMHNAAFNSTGINAVYIPFPVRDLASFMRRLVNPRTREIDLKIRGLSVTAPHKSAVMSTLDWIEPTAVELGAVNTIVVEGDQLHGYNTDGHAFMQVIKEAFGDLENARCAVIGSGGVARAVLWSLKQVAASAIVFARNESQAKALAAEFGAGCESLDKATFATFDLVINTTPLGTAGKLQEQTPACAAQFRGARLACDLVYNPLETRFLREARAAGCQTLGGLPVLVKQALEQFRLWTGVQAPEQVMLHAAHEALTSR
ncbi:MAG: shikimate dehydrogenase [Pyrinomonadaceae bacterium]